MIRARVFAICCGYEDADELDVLRCDPAFKIARGRLPARGRDLCSQPTLSRLENAPGLKDVIRLTYALVDQWMASYATPPSLEPNRRAHRADLLDCVVTSRPRFRKNLDEIGAEFLEGERTGLRIGHRRACGGRRG